MRLLLGSGGLNTPERKAAWVNTCDDFLGETDEVLFIPYAVNDYEKITQLMVDWKVHGGRKTTGIFTCANPQEAVEKAQAIHITGGNTFRLLHRLSALNLLAPIRARVKSGMPYIGISAGSNVAGPTIKTTNDMPIVALSDFKALGLVPFQINPHYTPSKTYYYVGDQLLPYGGESRDDRLREFFEMNDTPVLAMAEGGILRVEGDHITFTGTDYALVMQKDQAPIRIAPGDAVPLSL